MVLCPQRRGDYLGKTVQVIPHVTDAIQDWVEKVAHQPVDESGAPPEVCIIEVSIHGPCSARIEHSRADKVLHSFQSSSSEELSVTSSRHLSSRRCVNSSSESVKTTLPSCTFRSSLRSTEN